MDLFRRSPSCVLRLQRGYKESHKYMASLIGRWRERWRGIELSTFYANVSSHKPLVWPRKSVRRLIRVLVLSVRFTLGLENTRFGSFVTRRLHLGGLEEGSRLWKESRFHHCSSLFNISAAHLDSKIAAEFAFRVASSKSNCNSNRKSSKLVKSLSFLSGFS